MSQTSQICWYTHPPTPHIMASDHPSNSKVELSDSGLTVPSDSENYSANHEMYSSSRSTSSSPVVLYEPPSFLSMLRGAAINLILPFVNGLMLGFGELVAHETAFRLGWSNTKVRCWYWWSTYRLLLLSPYYHGPVYIDTMTDLPDIPTVKPRKSWYRNARDSATEEGK